MARIIIVGAGHNGLVCAFYLAKGGHKVTVLEQSQYIGGACRNETWVSGAIVSPGANHFGMLDARVASDMGLWDRGLSVVRADPQLVVGLEKGKSLCLYDDASRTYREMAHFSRHDADALGPFFADVALARTIVERHLFSPAPSFSDFVNDLNEARPGLDEHFARGSIQQTLDHYFESAEAKALFAATSFLYNADPAEAGTAFNLAYLSLSRANGAPGWGIPMGGMGRVVELMAQAAHDEGVQIVTDRAVVEILLAGNRAVGVKCSDGTQYFADQIVSNADPYTTLVKLAGQSPSTLQCWNDASFAGSCAKFNFVFSGQVLPECIHEDHVQHLARSAYVYLPSIEYAQKAFESASSGGYSERVYFEFVSPSSFDPALCPDGSSTGSAYCLFSNYDVLKHWSENARERAKAAVFAEILSQLGITEVLESEALDPLDLEKKFGMHRGNVDHGSQVPSNIFEHRDPGCLFDVDRLTICGSGTHPGGLVSGVPGFNAAQKLLAII